MTQNELISKLRAEGVVVTPRIVQHAIAVQMIPRPDKIGTMYDYTDEHMRMLDEIYRRHPKESP